MISKDAGHPVVDATLRKLHGKSSEDRGASLAGLTHEGGERR
jgi:hypothetical protein